MIRRGAPSLLAACLALLAGPAAAGAAGTRAASSVGQPPASATTPVTTPTTPTPSPQPKPKPKPKPQPKRARVTLYLPDAYFVNRAPVTVPGRTLHVGGVVRPYVAGQSITLRAYEGGRVFKRVRLRILRSRSGAYGRFSEALSAPAVGDVVVTVEHARSAQMLGFAARRGFAALDERVGFGSTGRFVELIQQRLAALHFYIPRTGVYDGGTGLAIDAYHRLLHWGTSQVLDHATAVWLLNGWGAFRVRYPRHGRHAEGNLSDQLLALIDGAHVSLIFPISSGKPSTPTILGDFQIYRRTPGYLPDGMYYSSFFTGGFAIHGYNPAPDYPASHGCMRLPIPDAIPAYDWLAMGDWVDVYY